jgi:hypothetical protein
VAALLVPEGWVALVVAVVVRQIMQKVEMEVLVEAVAVVQRVGRMAVLAAARGVAANLRRGQMVVVPLVALVDPAQSFFTMQKDINYEIRSHHK